MNKNNLMVTSALVIQVMVTIALGLWLTSAHAETLGIIRVPQDYPTIQLAINAALEGDTILVAPDTYTEIITITKSLT